MRIFYKDSQRTDEPLHKDTHTRDEIGEVTHYFGYATSEKLKAKSKQIFPNIICNSAPLYHEQQITESCLHQIGIENENRNKPHSCLFSYGHNSPCCIGSRRKQDNKLLTVPLY